MKTDRIFHAICNLCVIILLVRAQTVLAIENNTSNTGSPSIEFITSIPLSAGLSSQITSSFANQNVPSYTDTGGSLEATQSTLSTSIGSSEEDSWPSSHSQESVVADTWSSFESSSGNAEYDNSPSSESFSAGSTAGASDPSSLAGSTLLLSERASALSKSSAAYSAYLSPTATSSSLVGSPAFPASLTSSKIYLASSASTSMTAYSQSFQTTPASSVHTSDIISASKISSEGSSSRTWETSTLVTASLSNSNSGTNSDSFLSLTSSSPLSISVSETQSSSFSLSTSPEPSSLERYETITSQLSPVASPASANFFFIEEQPSSSSLSAIESQSKTPNSADTSKSQTELQNSSIYQSSSSQNGQTADENTIEVSTVTSSHGMMTTGTPTYYSSFQYSSSTGDSKAQMFYDTSADDFVMQTSSNVESQDYSATYDITTQILPDSSTSESGTQNTASLSDTSSVSSFISDSVTSGFTTDTSTSDLSLQTDSSSDSQVSSATYEVTSEFTSSPLEPSAMVSSASYDATSGTFTSTSTSDQDTQTSSSSQSSFQNPYRTDEITTKASAGTSTSNRGAFSSESSIVISFSSYDADSSTETSTSDFNTQSDASSESQTYSATYDVTTQISSSFHEQSTMVSSASYDVNSNTLTDTSTSDSESQFYSSTESSPQDPFATYEVASQTPTSDSQPQTPTSDSQPQTPFVSSTVPWSSSTANDDTTKSLRYISATDSWLQTTSTASLGSWKLPSSYEEPSLTNVKTAFSNTQTVRSNALSSESVSKIYGGLSSDLMTPELSTHVSTPAQTGFQTSSTTYELTANFRTVSYNSRSSSTRLLTTLIASKFSPSFTSITGVNSASARQPSKMPLSAESINTESSESFAVSYIGFTSSSDYVSSKTTPYSSLSTFQTGSSTLLITQSVPSSSPLNSDASQAIPVTSDNSRATVSYTISTSRSRTLPGLSFTSSPRILSNHRSSPSKSYHAESDANKLSSSSSATEILATGSTATRTFISSSNSETSSFSSITVTMQGSSDIRSTPRLVTATPNTAIPTWLPKTIVVQSSLPSSLTSTFNPDVTETLPHMIAPPTSVVPEPDSTLITIGFKFSLNYEFLVANPLASAQIFEFLPTVLSLPFEERDYQTNLEQIFTISSSFEANKTITILSPNSMSLVHQKRQSDTENRAFNSSSVKVVQIIPMLIKNKNYLVSIAEIYFPSVHANELAEYVAKTDSQLYNVSDSTLYSLASLIDSSIPCIGLIGAGTLPGPSSPLKPTRTGQSGSFGSGDGGLGASNSTTNIGPRIKKRLAIFLTCLVAGTVLWILSFMYFHRMFFGHRKIANIANSKPYEELCEKGTTTIADNTSDHSSFSGFPATVRNEKSDTWMGSGNKLNEYSDAHISDDLVITGENTVYSSSQCLEYFVDNEGNFYYSDANFHSTSDEGGTTKDEGDTENVDDYLYSDKEDRSAMTLDSAASYSAESLELDEDGNFVVSDINGGGSDIELSNGTKNSDTVESYNKSNLYQLTITPPNEDLDRPTSINSKCDLAGTNSNHYFNVPLNGAPLYANENVHLKDRDTADLINLPVDVDDIDEFIYDGGACDEDLFDVEIDEIDDENVADIHVDELDELDEEIYKRLSNIVERKNHLSVFERKSAISRTTAGSGRTFESTEQRGFGESASSFQISSTLYTGADVVTQSSHNTNNIETDESYNDAHSAKLKISHPLNSRNSLGW